MQAVKALSRRATMDDIDTLFELIRSYAEQGIMLPRSREALVRAIDTFVVAEFGDKVVGCGSLTKLGDDLVEIRSLGISDGYKGLGIGSLLVDRLLEVAKELNFAKAMALTYEVPFFLKNGFTVVPKEVFPQKVWMDCVNCPKQLACDEIAVLKLLN